MASSKTIGFVTQLEGSAHLRGLDGIVRLLSNGDMVHEGEVLSTGNAANVVIAFFSGVRMEVGANSKVLLDESVHRANIYSDGEILAQVEATQLALLQGKDISELEATAAGQGRQTVGTGLGDSSIYERTGEEGLVEIWGLPFEYQETDQTSRPIQSPLVNSTRSTVNPISPPLDAVDDAISVDEDGSVSGSVAGNDQPGETPSTFALAVGPANGALVFNSDGSYTYTPNPDFNGADSFSYTITDSDGNTDTATVSITVNSVEDMSDITVETGNSAVESVTEDVAVDGSGNLTTSGTLSVTDGDGDGAFNTTPVFTSSTAGSQLGSLTIDTSGNWSYVVDNSLDAVQGLDAGETIVETYTVSTADGNDTQIIIITINGADEPNTMPTLSGDATGTVYEAGLIEGTQAGNTTIMAIGSLTYADADSDSLTLVVNGSPIGTTLDGSTDVVATVNGTYGVLTVNGQGDWTYTLTSSADHQAVPNPIDEFVIQVNDGTVDSTDTATISIGVMDDNIVSTQTSHAYLVNNSGSVIDGILAVSGADNNYSADLSANIPGWDGATTTFTEAYNPSNPGQLLTSGGVQVYYYVDPSDPSVLYAYTDSSATPGSYDPANINQSLIFTLSVDPSTDSYQFQTFGTGDLAFTESMNLGMANGGNNNYLVMYENNGSYVVQGFGTYQAWLDTKTDADPTNDIYYDNAIMVMSGTTAADTVNWSNQGIGVSNNAMNAGEVLSMDFAAAAGQSVYGIVIGMSGLNGTETYTYTVTTMAGDIYTGTSTASSIEFTGLGELASVTITADAGSTFRVEPASTTLYFEPLGDVGPFNFDVGLVDGDGDVIAIPPTVSITIDNDSTATGTTGDESILYDAGYTSIDGGGGYDTLIIPNGEILDFNSVSNIEVIDLEQSGNHALTISYDDVFGATDAANELTILGDAADSVNLNDATGWSSAGQVTENGHTFNVYTHTSGATINVDDDIAGSGSLI